MTDRLAEIDTLLIKNMNEADNLRVERKILVENSRIYSLLMIKEAMNCRINNISKLEAMRIVNCKFNGDVSLMDIKNLIEALFI